MKYLFFILLTILVFGFTSCQETKQEEKEVMQKMGKVQQSIELSQKVSLNNTSVHIPTVPRVIKEDPNDLKTMEASNVNHKFVEGKILKAGKDVYKISQAVSEIKSNYAGKESAIFAEHMAVVYALRKILTLESIPSDFLITISEYYDVLEQQESREIGIMSQTLYILKDFYDQGRIEQAVSYIQKETVLSQKELQEAEQNFAKTEEFQSSSFSNDLHGSIVLRLRNELEVSREILSMITI